MSYIGTHLRLFKSGFYFRDFYHVLNHAFRHVYGKFTMLHFPLFVKEGEDFLQSQINLTRHCMSVLGNIENKRVLEIGCGNGVQSMHVLEECRPGSITGIDLNHSNIFIAKHEKARKGLENIEFFEDNSQVLRHFSKAEFDAIYCIESAFHYPDKHAFLKQLYRVLKPGGRFLIADILARKGKSQRKTGWWQRRMSLYHWELTDYLDSIRNAGLTLTEQEDITEKVIRGFLNYRAWLREIKKKNYFRYVLFRFFFWVNIKIDLYLFRKRRKYFILAGNKP